MIRIRYSPESIKEDSMVKIYDNIKDENGIDDPKRVRLFITKVEDDGTINEFLSGNSAVPMTNGTLFIVDGWLINQIDKVVFKDGALQVKDGEVLDEPVKTVLEREEEELLKRLAELRAKKTADTEEVTDEP